MTSEPGLNERVAVALNRSWPGAWMCLRCNFVEQRNVLVAGSGEVYADTRVERSVCPNEGADMVPYMADFLTDPVAHAEVIAAIEGRGWSVFRVYNAERKMWRTTVLGIASASSHLSEYAATLDAFLAATEGDDEH